MGLALLAGAVVVPEAAGAGVAGADSSGVALAAPVGAGEPSAIELAAGAFGVGAGFTVVPGVFVSGEVDPGGAAVVPGVAAGCESGPVLIISTPTLGWDDPPPAAPVLASSGVTTSFPLSAELAPFAEPVATENDGPCAPGRKTSVADTTSFGGLSCGTPL